MGHCDKNNNTAGGEIGSPSTLDSSGPFIPPTSNTFQDIFSNVDLRTIEDVVRELIDRVDKLEEEVNSLKADKILLEEEYE